MSMRGHASRAIATLALFSTTSGGHMTAECHAQLAEQISIAAGMGLRDGGEADQGPATRTDTFGQQLASAADERISCGTPMKKDAKPHRKRGSL